MRPATDLCHTRKASAGGGMHSPQRDRQQRAMQKSSGEWGGASAAQSCHAQAQAAREREHTESSALRLTLVQHPWLETADVLVRTCTASTPQMGAGAYHGDTGQAVLRGAGMSWARRTLGFQLWQERLG